MAPRTRERVQAVLDSTGYHVNAIAQSLRTKRVATVAHILNSLFPNPFFSNVARGLQREATKLGYEVLVYNAENSAALEREAVLAALRRRVDAIIFTTPLQADNVEAATNAGVRVVQVERPTEAPSAVVNVDNYCGSKEATEYLISLGHRNIGFIGERPDKHSGSGWLIESARLCGYSDAVHEAELPSTVKLGEYWTKNVPEFQTAGREYMLEILAGDVVPTAIFAASDMLAAGVLQALYAKRMRVPDDMSVIGFDDTFAAALTPPLTTVVVPTGELGEAALRCAVIEPLEDRVELKTHLVIRDSTGAVALPSGKTPALSSRPSLVPHDA